MSLQVSDSNLTNYCSYNIETKFFFEHIMF